MKNAAPFAVAILASLFAMGAVALAQTVDSTVVGDVEDIVVLFGVPIGWLFGAITLVVGWVNTIKVLLANWINSKWVPVIGFLVSAIYSIVSLAQIGWGTVVAGTIGLWFATWGTWWVAKSSFVAFGARPK